MYLCMEDKSRLQIEFGKCLSVELCFQAFVRHLAHFFSFSALRARTNRFGEIEVISGKVLKHTMLPSHVQYSLHIRRQ